MVVDIIQGFLGAVIDVRKYDVRKYMVAVGQEGLVDDALTVGFDKALEDEFLEEQALRFKWLAGPVTADNAVGTRFAQTVGALVAQEGAMVSSLRRVSVTSALTRGSTKIFGVFCLIAWSSE